MSNEELHKLWVDKGQGMKALKSVYQQGRADAIDEYRDMLLKECIETPNECWNLECPFADDVCRIITIAEQLKEQKNDSLVF